MDLFDIAVAKKMSGGGGGGGSSDFSLATITKIDPDNSHGISGAFACTLPLNPPVEASYIYDMFSNQLILYKGAANIEVYGSVASISGSISLISGNAYLVTGDCTIEFESDGGDINYN